MATALVRPTLSSQYKSIHTALKNVSDQPVDPCRAAANTDLKDAVSREGFKSLLDVTNSSLSRAGRERIPGRDSDAPVTFHCLRNEGREKKIDGAAVERNLRTKSHELLNVGGWNSLPKYPSELLMN